MFHFCSKLTLEKRNGEQAGDNAGKWWDDFEIDYKWTKTVKFTIQSVYEGGNSYGFFEIEIYGKTSKF